MDTVFIKAIRQQLKAVDTLDNSKLNDLCRRINLPEGNCGYFDCDEFAGEMVDVTEYLGKGAYRAVYATNMPGWVVNATP